MTTMRKGIDVSKHQGIIDWQKVKEAGIAFAMIRAGYGAGTVDARAHRNFSECNRLGIPCGAYWFSYAHTEEMARREARACLAAVAPYRLDYPIAFDFEYDSVTRAAKAGVTVTKDLASRIARAFCETIEAAGHYVINYANRDYLGRYFDEQIRRRYDLWLAQWPKEPDLARPPECGIWQYSSTGRVPGIDGDVDLDVTYQDYPALLAQQRGDAAPPKEPIPPKAEEPGTPDEGGPDDGPKEETEGTRARAWARAQGISDGERPDGPATREQVWVMLYRMTQQEGSRD